MTARAVCRTKQQGITFEHSTDVVVPNSPPGVFSTKDKERTERGVEKRYPRPYKQLIYISQTPSHQTYFLGCIIHQKINI
nr:hypothetical protein CFP56_14672 [Quercus suber]